MSDFGGITNNGQCRVADCGKYAAERENDRRTNGLMKSPAQDTNPGRDWRAQNKEAQNGKMNSRKQKEKITKRKTQENRKRRLRNEKL